MSHKIRRAVIGALVCVLVGLVAIAAAQSSDPHDWPIHRRIQPWTINAKLVQHLTDWGYFVPDDYHSELVNVDNGLRRTTGQPQHYRATIYVFGNSTVFNSYLPDAYTLPSQLQAIARDYRVVNMGYDGSTIPVEYARLRLLNFLPSDTIIFYDGLSDAELGVWTATYCALDYAAREHVHARGGHFLHVLQPYLFSRALSVYEQAIAAWGKADSAHYMLYPAYRLCADADLSHALDAVRAAGKEVFVDQWHLSAEANGIVAHTLYDILFPIL